MLRERIFPQATSRYLDKPLPQGWEEDTQIFQQVLPVDDQWWKAFQDPVLDSLISVAVKQNYSVLTAIDRINMAKANLRMEGEIFSPKIWLNAGWTRQQSSGNTSDLPQSTQHYYDASLNMNWELDLFGGSWTPYYCIGLLTADAGSDLTNAASWKKQDTPVFEQQPEDSVFGPGSPSFVPTPDEKEWYMLYHARKIPNDAPGATDSRSPRLQKISWDANGMPVLGKPCKEGTQIK